MMKEKLALTFWFLCFSAACSTALAVQAVNLLANGDFESPRVEPDPPYWWGVPDNWTVTGNGKLDNEPDFWYAMPYGNILAGDQIIWSSTSAEFSQDVGVVYEAGKTYVFNVGLGLGIGISPSDYYLELRDVETGSTWAQGDQDDFGQPTEGWFDLMASISYTVPATSGPAGKHIRAVIGLTDNGTDADNAILYIHNPLNLTVGIDPNNAGIDTITPAVGQHEAHRGYSFIVEADTFYDCPNVLGFDHWVGDGIADPYQNPITILMDTNKTITAVFADANQCGDYCHPYPEGDINRDCIVNFKDYRTLAKHWLE